MRQSWFGLIVSALLVASPEVSARSQGNLFAATPPVTAVPTPACLSRRLPSFAADYRAGWNLIGVPSDTVLGSSVASLYAYDPNTAAYTPVDAGVLLVSGAGYLAYFPEERGVQFIGGPLEAPSVSLPAGEWILVGNPLWLPAVMSLQPTSAATVYTYDPRMGSYTLDSSLYLEPGQGAWVYSMNASILTFAGCNVVGTPPLPLPSASPAPGIH